MEENGLLAKRFYREPLFVAVCIFMLIVILLAFFHGCLSESEITTTLLNIATLGTLVVTAIYIFKYWKETQRTNKITLKNMAYSRLPILDFKTEVHYQDAQATYYDELISITNKGYGPAFHVSLQKLPLPDNAQRSAMTGKTGPNNPFQKTYPIVGVGETFVFCREDGYPTKEIQIVIRFKNMFKERFEWEYKGAPQRLQLSRWHIDPATKKQEYESQPHEFE
jgi:hypothetical protein